MALDITPNPLPGRPGGGPQPVRPGPSAVPGTDPVAVVALVLAFLAPLVGLVLGIVALVRTKARAGRELAVAATVVSTLGVLLAPVLAAIAIPVFLSQREAGRDAAVEAELRTAAVAMEESFVERGAYGDLQGFVPDRRDVTVTLVATDGLSYCLAGSHALGRTTTYLDSATGTVSDVPCR